MEEVRAKRAAGSPLLRRASRPGPLAVDAPTAERTRARARWGRRERARRPPPRQLKRRDARAEGASHGGRVGGKMVGSAERALTSPGVTHGAPGYAPTSGCHDLPSAAATVAASGSRRGRRRRRESQGGCE